MKIRAWKFAWVALLLSIAGGLQANPTMPADSKAASMDFKYKDTQGKTWQLSALKGQWVLLNFWAPWCPPCWFEMPALNDLHVKGAQRSPKLVVIGIAMDYSSESSVHDTVKRNRVTYPIVLGGSAKDKDSADKQVGPVPFYPVTYLFSPDGKMAMFKAGMVDHEDIMAVVLRYENKHENKNEKK